MSTNLTQSSFLSCWCPRQLPGQHPTILWAQGQRSGDLLTSWLSFFSSLAWWAGSFPQRCCWSGYWSCVAWISLPGQRSRWQNVSNRRARDWDSQTSHYFTPSCWFIHFFIYLKYFLEINKKKFVRTTLKKRQKYVYLQEMTILGYGLVEVVWCSFSMDREERKWHFSKTKPVGDIWWWNWVSLAVVKESAHTVLELLGLQ